MNFSTLIIELMESHLNLMLSEVLQCKLQGIPLDLKNEDHEVLVKQILNEIKTGKVKSAHITKEHAERALKVYDSLLGNQDVLLNTLSIGDVTQMKEEQNKNVIYFFKRFSKIIK